MKYTEVCSIFPEQSQMPLLQIVLYFPFVTASVSYKPYGNLVVIITTIITSTCCHVVCEVLI